MAIHDRKIRKVRNPGYGKGFLFDVWFTAEGRTRLREKICVVTKSNRKSVKAWATNYLHKLVWERYEGRIQVKGRWSKIEVTDRPNGNLVWSVRFDGEQKGKL